MIARLLSAIWPDRDAEIIQRAIDAAFKRGDMRAVGNLRAAKRTLRIEQLRGSR